MPLTKKMTLIKRIVLWLSAIASVTFLVLIFIGIEIRESIRENGLIRIENILKQKNRAIDSYIHQRYSALNNLERLIYSASHHHFVFSADFWKNPPESLQNNLLLFASENGFYDIFFITLDGDIVNTIRRENDLYTNLYTGAYKSTELSRVFRDAVKKQQPYVTDFYFYEPSQNYAAFIAVPVLEEEEIIGIIAVQIDNVALQAVINDDVDLGQTGEIIATVERDGGLLTMASIRNSDIKAFTRLDPQLIYFMSFLKNHRNGHRYMHSRTGKQAAVAWNYHDDLRWTIVASIDESELLQEWSKQVVSLFLLFIAGVIVVIVMIVIALRSFARPIYELTDYALMMSKGNYNIDLNTENYDAEWQLLIRVFKQMSVEINRQIEQLNDKNILLSTQKQEIEALNQNLEAKVKEKSRMLKEYVDIVDRYVITSQTDIYGNIIYASNAFCEISGYTKEELIGKSHRIVRHPDMPNEVFEAMWKTISNGGIWTGEMKNLKSDGGYYWVDTAISPTYHDGVIVGYTAIRHDITNQKKIEELVITDSLTGLFNRRHYTQIIQSEINRARRNKQTFALMMVDVDNFKFYNDTYGHQAGDYVLVKVADVFDSFTSRSGDYAFRIGGEEFAVLITNESESEYLKLAEMIRNSVEAMKLPHEKNPVSGYVTISIGMVIVFSTSDISADELYQKADKQLYLAKERGRNRVNMVVEE